MSKWQTRDKMIAELQAENERLRKLLLDALGVMDYLGDLLNAMDAVEQKDITRTAPVFDEVRKEVESWVNGICEKSDKQKGGDKCDG